MLARWAGMERSLVLGAGGGGGGAGGGGGGTPDGGAATGACEGIDLSRRRDIVEDGGYTGAAFHRTPTGEIAGAWPRKS